MSDKSSIKYKENTVRYKEGPSYKEKGNPYKEKSTRRSESQKSSSSSSKRRIKWDQVLPEAKKFLSDVDQATLRQIHYAMLNSADKTGYENTEQAYKSLSRYTVQWRESGDLDINRFIDEQRSINRGYAFWEDRSPEQSIELSLDSLKDLPENYRVPRQVNQDVRIIVAGEKAGIVRTVDPVCGQYDIPSIALKGYSSMTTIARDLRKVVEDVPEDIPIVFLMLTDFDPSGDDMVRDINNRIQRYIPERRIIVKKIGLTREQVQKYRLPGLPAKKSDSRFSRFEEKYGGMDVTELDALNPKILNSIVEGEIASLLDKDILDKTIQRELAERAELQEMVDGIFASIEKKKKKSDKSETGSLDQSDGE